MTCVVHKKQHFEMLEAYRRQADEDFIHIYRSEPCLWRVKSKEYHDREMREAAYARLLQKMRETEPTATQDDVTKKINSMRSAYRRQLKEIANSIISESDEVCRPTLWYYHLLTFLQDQEVFTHSDEEREMENIEVNIKKESPEEIYSVPDVHFFTRNEDSTQSRTDSQHSLAEERQQSTVDDRISPTLVRQAHTPNPSGHETPPQQNLMPVQHRQPHLPQQHQAYDPHSHATPPQQIQMPVQHRQPHLPQQNPMHGQPSHAAPPQQNPMHGQPSHAAPQQNQMPVQRSQPPLPQQNQTLDQHSRPSSQHSSTSSEHVRTPAPNSAIELLSCMATSYDVAAPNSKRLHPQPESSEDKLPRGSKRSRADPVPSAPEDRFDLLGKLVAVKLRAMPPEKSLFAEKYINDMLFDAEFGSFQKRSAQTYHHHQQQQHSSQQRHVRNGYVAGAVYHPQGQPAPAHIRAPGH